MQTVLLRLCFVFIEVPLLLHCLGHCLLDSSSSSSLVLCPRAGPWLPNSPTLGFQPSSSYPHMKRKVYHLINLRSCPFMAFPLVSFLPFSLLAPISLDHLPLQHVQSSSSFGPISFLLSFFYYSWS